MLIPFLVVGVAALVAAVGVVTSRNVVHSVLWLIAHLCSLAVLYLTLSAPFLGLVQVLLYAGAVMVLFLFVIGLLSARGVSTPGLTGRLPGQTGLALGAGIVAAAVLLIGAAGGVVVAHPGALPLGWGGAGSFGAEIFGPYLLPFEATAMILLTALVAVVALTQGHDEDAAAGGPGTGTVGGVPEAADGLVAAHAVGAGGERE